MPDIDLHAKISKAKAKLIVEYPFFGTLASKLELIADENIQAFKSDGKSLHYSPDFFESAPSSQIEFTLANGAMHASLAHTSRKSNRSGWLWQMATDFAVNDMLVQNGLDCPSEANYRVRFSGMYAEEIYAELKDDILREDENLEYEADNSEDVEKKEDHKPKETSLSESQKSEALLEEQLFDEFVQALIEQEQKSDGLPQSLERFFHLQKRGHIDWRSELKHALDRYFVDDYAFMPPSKKYLHMGLYLPSERSETFRLVVAIDSSGSVDEKLLELFLSELNYLLLSLKRYEVELLVCDEKIRLAKTFLSGESVALESVVGGGGTDFREVFWHVENELPFTNLLLYFTDLAGRFPHATPSYEVRWIAPKMAEVPFGEIILLED